MKEIETRQFWTSPTLQQLWLSTGMQTLLDVSVLLGAFVLSYLLRFDFVIPQSELRNLLVQAPLVVLLQFVALTVAGGRTFIWRYTGMAHLKSFLYAALGSMVVVGLLRLQLPAAYQAWRVPLSVNFIDNLLAFGGAFGLRVLRRAYYERNQKRGNVKVNGNGKDRRPVLLIDHRNA